MAIAVSLESTKGDLRPGLSPNSKCSDPREGAFAPLQKHVGPSREVRGLLWWDSDLEFHNPHLAQLPGKHQGCFFIFILVITHRSFFPLVHPPWLRGIEFPIQLIPFIQKAPNTVKVCPTRKFPATPKVTYSHQSE